jgi:hypothetical protein
MSDTGPAARTPGAYTRERMLSAWGVLVVSAGLVLALPSREWIEETTHVSLDGGSGAVEIGASALLLLMGVALLLAGALLRRERGATRTSA